MRSKKQGPMQQGRPDDFQTPIDALIPLYPFLPKDWTIWEPACGKGNLVKALSDKGYNVISSDILQGEDFLMANPTSDYHCIITNPPYSLKQEFLARAYQLKKPFAFLLPLTTFETRKRQELFETYGVEVVMFDKRINFETPSGQGSGSWFATAWFTNGLNIGKQLTFVKFGKEQDENQLNLL